MAADDLFILGIHMTKFGKHPDQDLVDLASEAVTGALIKEYGRKFYYITLDYAFGHTLEAAMVKACTALGGSRVGGVLTPLGTVDFSSYLIGAQSANPDVIVFLLGGDDMVNGKRDVTTAGYYAAIGCEPGPLHFQGSSSSIFVFG